MSLAEHLAEPASKGCKVADIIAQLDGEDRDVLLKALADLDGYSNRRILRALRAEDHAVGRTTLQEHRAGVCRCGTR